MLRLVRYIWPIPYTLLGAALGLLAIMMGAKAQCKQGVLAIAGGQLPQLIKRLPLSKTFVAITLGHVILSENKHVQAQFWRHECVHVRQYERWGVLFVPAYCLAGAWVWAQGKHIYRDNPFELEAYAQEAETD